ncbi:MAG: shikimate kinase [Bacteroidales bacterium]|nr:shikimate kinase [Bacteroidales bacterium]
MIRRIFLVGFMGSGKTTIGKFIAHDMNLTFVDMDDYFEQKHNCTIKQYFALHGEDGFRKAENEVVAELCEKQDVIVATGGGAPCFYNNMELMRKAGLTIYLNVEPADLAKRLSNAKENRPLLADKTDEELLAYIESKLGEREGFYRQAHLIVDGEHLPFSTYKTLIEMFPEDELN